ncbi:PD-(D/E)XK motif protein [Glutamicibacter sp. BW77]|uniref:PD-(D/E)XK motif protein n=1 Tax=Glutamicibacter sp. BW77 TaxID=2024402 RepID=UPI000BB7E5A0|nr:PD-(D/E)XK motif protein [Glutamicibacter sp. BW77]PCC36918.1 hypothetical protein CIK74_03705 [Glutamicibacter sp. BW77]
MDLKKWSTRVEAGENGYWELDSTLPVRMIYGLDPTGRYSFGYFSELQPMAHTISKAIDTVTRQRSSDGEWTQIFVLNDPSLKGPFVSFCDHMAREIAAAHSIEAARHSVQGTISRWKRLFSRGFGTLDLPALRGLYGELQVGFNLTKASWSHDQAAGAWTGPYDTPHDFDFGKFSVEVKSRSLGKSSVHINGEEQLQGDRLFLAVVEVSHTQSSEDGFETLPEAIRDIQGKLSESGADAMRMGLEELGFDIEEEAYKNIFFRALDTYIYAVDSGFPRIIPNVIPLGVSRVSYELSLDAISDYEVEKIVC